MNDFEEGMQLVHALMIARQGGSQIKPESIDAHFEDPVAQAVHHQLKRARMQQVKRVTSAGEIEVETRIIRLQPIVSEIVDPAEAQRGAKMISLGSMIVNYIEDHFDTSRVEIAYHRFELDDLFAELSTIRRTSRRVQIDGTQSPRGWYRSDPRCSLQSYCRGKSSWPHAVLPRDRQSRLLSVAAG